MARDHARIYTSIWGDPDFLALTESEQLTYLKLVSSPDVTWCGVLPLLPQRLGRLSADGTPAKAMRALRRLHAADFLVIDEETGEVAIRSFVRRDGIMKQPRVLIAAIRAWGKVHSEPIRDRLREEFGRAYREALPKGFSEGGAKAIAHAFPEGYPKGFAQPVGKPHGRERELAGARAFPSPFPLPSTTYVEHASSLCDAREISDDAMQDASR